MRLGAAVGAPCPLCGTSDATRIGIRGTREYAGADPRAEPHLVTYVLRCRNCDYFFVESLSSEAAPLEERHYADPLLYGGMKGGNEQSLTLRLAAIERHGARGRLLDVGAGKGEFVRVASAAGWNAEGIEPSAALAHDARAHGANVRAGYLDPKANLPTGAFDAVTLLHVLEHVDKPVDMLRSLQPYLTPGGVIFVEVPNCDSYLLRFVDFYYAARGLRWSSRLSPFHPPYHRWGHSRKSLVYALKQSGYSVKEVGTFSGGDRGYGVSGSARRALLLIREWSSKALEVFGNRELLYAVARIQ
jgi:SAM-dependent methyltransferase